MIVGDKKEEGRKGGMIGRNKTGAPDRVGKNPPLATVACHFGRQHFYYLGKILKPAILMA